MRGQVRTIERNLAWIASQAHGVVTRPEALAAGLSVMQLERKLASGSLVPCHRGVYFLAYKPQTTESRYLAAVKACGPGAVLTGMAAAWLWELLPRWWDPPAPEVTAPSERRVPGVITHRRRRMDSRDGTRWRGIPVTTVPATLVAISSSLPFDDLGKAVHEAGVKYRIKGDQVERVLERHPTAKGRQRLLAIARGDAPIVLSRLERHFLRLLRSHRLQRPETNRPSGAGYIDCRWPAHRLTAELDSYRFHSSRHAWEKDRQRERDARARGDEFRRLTWLDVVEDPAPTIADMTRLLG